MSPGVREGTYFGVGKGASIAGVLGDIGIEISDKKEEVSISEVLVIWMLVVIDDITEEEGREEEEEEEEERLWITGVSDNDRLLGWIPSWSNAS